MSKSITVQTPNAADRTEATYQAPPAREPATDQERATRAGVAAAFATMRKRLRDLNEHFWDITDDFYTAARAAGYDVASITVNGAPPVAVEVENTSHFLDEFLSYYLLTAAERTTRPVRQLTVMGRSLFAGLRDEALMAFGTDRKPADGLATYRDLVNARLDVNAEYSADIYSGLSVESDAADETDAAPRTLADLAKILGVNLDAAETAAIASETEDGSEEDDAIDEDPEGAGAEENAA